MENIGMGAGIGAFGFWMFIAAVVLGGIWDGIRKREAQHETLRRAIESGQEIDAALTDKILSTSGTSKDNESDLKIGGLITLSVAPGLVIFGWIMGKAFAEELFTIMLAVSAIVTCVAIGLLVASRVAEQSKRKDSLSSFSNDGR